MNEKKIKKVPNVPNLRFPNYKNHWFKLRIKDLLSICHGKDYKHLKCGDVPVLGSGGIITFVDQYLCNWECVLIGRKGTIDKPQYMSKPFWSVDTLFYSKPKSNQSPKFQYYLFGTINWNKHNEGSGIPSLSASTIESLIVMAPDIDEQIKIATFLTKIDERIETQIKIIKDIQSLKKWIINQQFTRNSNSIIGEYIEQTSERNKEKNVDRVLSVSNKYGFINQNEQFEDREVASNDKTNYKIVRKNDFAFNPARINVGSIAKLNSYNIGIVSPMYICFRVNNENLNFEYLSYYFLSNSFQNALNKRLEGSVRQCLQFDALCDIKLYVPSLKEQNTFVCKIKAITEKLIIEKDILTYYKKQKAYLLKNMFI